MPTIGPSLKQLEKLTETNKESLDQEWIRQNELPQHEVLASKAAQIARKILGSRADPMSIHPEPWRHETPWYKESAKYDNISAVYYRLEIYYRVPQLLDTAPTLLMCRTEQSDPVNPALTRKEEDLIALFGVLSLFEHEETKWIQPGVTTIDNMGAPFKCKALSSKSEEFLMLSDTLDFIATQVSLDLIAQEQL